MTHSPLKLVHASDLHLERPAYGVAEVPDPLRELFVESPYLAAEQVFETVLSEDADMLLLAGDVVDPHTAGARAMVFLSEQFDRLAERGIQVYWAGGSVDPPRRVADALSLPKNVHLFPAGRAGEILHQRGGEPIARVIGMSHKARSKVSVADFRPDPTGLFSIGMAYGDVDQAALDAQRVNYLALGGRHARFMAGGADHEAHYPGSPQGRCPQEAGPHGCTVLRAEQDGTTHAHFVTTDVMRWVTEQITIDESMDRSALEETMHERILMLREASPQLDLLISWTIAGTGPLMCQLRGDHVASQLIAALREKHGTSAPVAWSLSLSAEPNAVLPSEWYDQETILGDFLRFARQYQIDRQLPIDLEPLLAERYLAGSVASSVAIDDNPTRQRILRQVALLGLDLLSPESDSDQPTTQHGVQEARA